MPIASPTRLVAFSFCAATLLASAVGFVASAPSLFDANFASGAVAVSIIAAWLFFVSMTILPDLKNALEFFLFLLLVSLPMVLMFLHYQPGRLPFIAFWLSMLEWVLITIMVLWSYKSGWSSFLLLLGTATTTASIFCRLGKLHLLSSYAIAPIEQIHSLGMLLDFRVLLGSIFAILIIATAASRAFSLGLPSIPDVPVVQLPSPQDRLPKTVAIFLTPFFVVFNYVYLFLSRLFNVLWKSVATILIYLSRVGVEMVLTIRELLQSIVLSELLKIYGLLFFSLLSFSLATRSVAAALKAYLVSGDWSQSGHLLLGAGLKICGLFLTGFIVALIIDKDSYNYENSLASVSSLLTVLLLSGVPLYTISFLGLFPVKGFHSLGPFSLLVLILVCLGVLVSILVPKRP